MVCFLSPKMLRKIEDWWHWSKWSPWNYTEQVLVSVRGNRTHRTGLYRCLVRMQKGILREFHKYILKHSNLRGPGSQIFKGSKEGEGGCWINKLFHRGSHKIMTWTEKKPTIPSPPLVVYRIQWNCFYTGESREQALFMAHKKRAAANCGTRCDVSNIRKPKSLGFFLSRNYGTSVHFIDLFVYPTWVVSCLKDQKCVQLRYKPFGKP